MAEMTLDEVTKRVKALAQKDNLFCPADKSLYKSLQDMANKSVPTDIVEVCSEEMHRFANYWKRGRLNDDNINEGFVPADLLIEKTIPITDMIIRHKEMNLEIRIVIYFPKEDLRRYIESPDGEDCSNLVIGAVIFTAPKLIFPLSIEFSKEAIGIIGTIAMIDVEYSQFIRNFNYEFKLFSTEWKETLLYIIGLTIPAWYGMQLALLHPVTKQVFANPIKEKRDRKERLKPVIIDGKTKTVKYIRRHVITAENCINKAIDDALKSLADETLSSDSTKRTYERHTALWRVIGHHRLYKNGKRTWIRPYWKGLLKDMASLKANNREIDIPDEDI